jgi:V/A-type H+-transporting ATPase subunit E
MGLEKIQQGILSGAEEQRRRMLEEEAKAQADAILAEAQEQRKRALEQAKREAGELVTRERNEKVAAARLRARRMLAEAREDALNEVMQRLRAELAAYAKKRDYEKTLRRLAESAAKEIGGDVVLHTNKHDERFLLRDGMGQSIECIGGVLVSSKDGRISINNTFDALLEERREELRSRAFSMLFGSAAKARVAAKAKGRKKNVRNAKVRVRKRKG